MALALIEAFGLAEVRGSKLVLEVGAGLEMVMLGFGEVSELKVHEVAKLFFVSVHNFLRTKLLRNAITR